VLATAAAAKRDAAALQTCLDSLKQLPETPAWTIPDVAALLQTELPDRVTSLAAANAAAEALRTAILISHAEHTATALKEFRRHLAAAAPPTAEARTLLAKTKGNESAVRRQIQTALRESDAGRLDALYRTAVTRSTSLAHLAEERRSQFVLQLSRIAASGGAEQLRQSLNEAPELLTELQLDELRGLVSFAALTSGKPLPELAITTATTATAAPRSALPQMLVELGRAVGAAAALEASNPTDALRWIEQGTDTLPAVRSACAAEFSGRLSTMLPPPTVLAAVAACKNGLWREECFEIAGRNLAERGLAAGISEWVASSRPPPQEHIALLYGTGLSQVASLNKPATAQP